MTQKQLTSLCREWQAQLRLQDWEVEINLCRVGEISDNRAGEVTTITAKQTAKINILHPDCYPTTSIEVQDIERTIVHELLHLSFALVDDVVGLQNTLYEQAIHKTACALVAIKRGT